MADVNSPGVGVGGGMFGAMAREQYAALASLRWLQLRNGLRSINGILDLGATGIALLFFTVVSLALGFGLGAAAYGIASQEHWQYLPLLFWALCLLWQMVPVLFASYQQQLDLSMLLRFPVRFDSFFLMYLFFGLMDASTIMGGVLSIGVCTGITLARPALFGWTAISLVVFAAFNILLVRAVFAWVERWLAQRKTREILGALFMVAILSLQLLNPAIYRKRPVGHSGAEQQAEQLRAAQQRYAPFLKRVNAVQSWLPPGLAAGAVHRSTLLSPMDPERQLGLLGVYGLVVGVALALRLKAEYRGENLGSAPGRVRLVAAKSKTARMEIPDHAGFVSAGERRPGISGPIAAVIEKEARSLLRTLPLLYAIGAPLLLVVVFSSIFIRNGNQAPTFPLALPICMVYAQLGFTQIFYNNLGAEGAGIQLYFFSPTPIRTVMLAKNIFHSFLFGISALLAGVLGALRVGVPDNAVLAATAAWIVFALPCNLAAGDIISIKMAFRVNPGRIGRAAGSQGNSLFSLAVQLGFVCVGGAVFSLCWFLHNIWLAVPIFLFLALAAVFVWRKILGNVDALANERKVELIATLMKAG
jgi:ABC-2 type transport system permease protein